MAIARHIHGFHLRTDTTTANAIEDYCSNDSYTARLRRLAIAPNADSYREQKRHAGPVDSKELDPA